MNPAKPRKKKSEVADIPAIFHGEAPPPAPIASPRIRRDESNAKLSYANFFNVSSTREETALMFGMVQASPNPSQEIVVEVSNRVVLTPHAAKRLQLMLGRVLGEYETRFGSLSIDPK